MKILQVVVLFLILSIFCAGCAADYERIRKKVISSREWTKQEKAEILEGKLKIGMTKERAEISLKASSYFQPSIHKTKTTTVYGTREDWFVEFMNEKTIHLSFNEQGFLDYWNED